MGTRVEPGDGLLVENPGTAPGVVRRLGSLLWLMLFLVHLIGAALWLGLQPGGFPATHPRFWVNRAVPVLAMICAAGSIRALHKLNRPLTSLWLIVWAALWAGLAVGSRIAFPETLERVWLVPLAGSFCMAIGSYAHRPAGSRPYRLRAAALAGFWFCIGVGCVLSQRPPRPSTTPVGDPREFQVESTAPSRPLREGDFSFPSGLMVQSGDGSVTMRLQGLTLFIDPLLRFQSRSPDGCWTAFVPDRLREGGEPRLVSGRVLDPGQQSLWSYRIRDQGPARLTAEVSPDSHATRIEALSRLDRPIHSHLNSFCDLGIRGHRRLFLEFSPCPEVKVEVRKFDYPFGRPARFAYVDRQRRFRVVEATSGEKGPFHVLAEGRLERPDPLQIILHDEDRPMARVTLHDWSAQAGTELSPTAGWGVPVNAIEFSLNGESPAAAASIFVTLAATSVGRGWDCVTHPAGTYRNRITVEPWSP